MKINVFFCQYLWQPVYTASLLLCTGCTWEWYVCGLPQAVNAFFFFFFFWELDAGVANFSIKNSVAPLVQHGSNIFPMGDYVPQTDSGAGICGPSGPPIPAPESVWAQNFPARNRLVGRRNQRWNLGPFNKFMRFTETWTLNSSDLF